MKKIVILLIFVLSQIANAQWIKTGDINNVKKFDVVDNRVFAYRSYGLNILNSTEDSWSEVNWHDSCWSSSYSANENVILLGCEFGGNYKYSKIDSIWSKLDSSLGQLAQIEDTDSVFFALNRNGKLFISNDDGTTWDSVFSPYRIGVFYLLGNNIIAQNLRWYSYKSFQDTLWTKLTYFDSTTFISNICSYNGNFLAASNKGILITKDNGITWDDFSLKDEIILYVNSYNNHIIIGKYPKLLYSKDDGISWMDRTLGLRGGTLRNSVFWKDNIYISWSIHSPIPNGQIYKMNLSYLEELSVFSDGSQNSFCISPNPATDFIEISLGTQKAMPLQIRIYDVFGQEVNNPLTPFDKGELGSSSSQLSIQNSQLRVDVSTLVPGLYFVRVGNNVGKFLKI